MSKNIFDSLIELPGVKVNTKNRSAKKNMFDSLAKISNNYVPKAGKKYEEENKFWKVLRNLNKPTAALAKFVDNIIDLDFDDAFTDAWKELKQGGEYSFMDLAKKRMPYNTPNYLKIAVGFLGDVILDPLNLVGIGLLTKAGKGAKVGTISAKAAKAAKAAGKFAGKFDTVADISKYVKETIGGAKSLKTASKLDITKMLNSVPTKPSKEIIDTALSAIKVPKTSNSLALIDDSIKASKAATSKASKAAKAEDAIQSANKIRRLSKATDEVLKPTITEQAKAGQRALLQVAGKTVVKGEKVLEAYDKLYTPIKNLITIPFVKSARKFKNSELGKTLSNMFTRNSSIPKIETAINNYVKLKKGLEARHYIFAESIAKDINDLIKTSSKSKGVILKSIDGLISSDRKNIAEHLVKKFNSFEPSEFKKISTITKKLLNTSDELSNLKTIVTGSDDVLDKGIIPRSFIDVSSKDKTINKLTSAIRDSLDSSDSILQLEMITYALSDTIINKSKNLFKKADIIDTKELLSVSNLKNNIILNISDDIAYKLNKNLIKQLPEKLTVADVDNISNIIKDIKIDKIFDTNVINNLFTSSKKNIKDISNANLLTELSTSLGSDKYTPGWLQLDPLYANKLGSVSSKYFDPVIKPEIEKVLKYYTKSENINIFWKGFDKIQNIWKAWTLAPIPSYHIRNVVGNIFNNNLADIRNPKLYADASLFQNKKLTARFANYISKKYNYTPEQIIKHMIDYDVIDAGRLARDLPKDLSGLLINSKPEGILNTLLNYGKKIASPSTDKNVIITSGRKIGNVIENNARIAHFLGKLSEGLNPKASAESVQKYLFDYGDITLFEKTYAKRIIPFFTFFRKNTPLQIESILTKPNKYRNIIKGKKAIEMIAGTDKLDTPFLSEWMKEGMPLKVDKDKEGNVDIFLANSWLPMDTINELSAESLIDKLTPLFKVPIEHIKNFNSFFGSPIERYKGETGIFVKQRFTKKTINLLRNIRVLNELDRFIKAGVFTLPEHNTIKDYLKKYGIVLGLKTYKYNSANSYKIYDAELRNSIKELKKELNDAHADKDIKTVKLLETKIANIQSERNELKLKYKKK